MIVLKRQTRSFEKLLDEYSCKQVKERHESGQLVNDRVGAAGVAAASGGCQRRQRRRRRRWLSTFQPCIV